MTEKDLLDFGFEKRLCKIGYLYFKDNFFCSLHNGAADVRSCFNDMVSLGVAKSLKELIEIKINYYNRLIHHHKAQIKALELTIENEKNKLTLISVKENEETTTDS